MCGIGGFCDLTRDNRQWKWEKTGERMCRTLERRGPDDGGLWVGKDCVLAHRRLAVIDPANGQQPMVRTGGTGQVVLVYNGELYNTDPLRRELEKRGHVFSTRTDTEVVLEAWRAYGEQMGEHLEGIYAFAIWDEGRQTLFCCRDRFGVKPFFYAMVGDTFVFGSEPKTLFYYPGLTPRADETTWREVLGISPARTAGVGVFQGILELKPAHQLTFRKEGLNIRRYWNVTSRVHTEDYPETVEHLKELLRSAIRRQLVSDVPLCTLLSGGLDSSIITAVAAKAYQEWGLPPLATYSFDYTDNQKYFHPSSFQPDADWPWVERMVEMDSSLLYFCSRIREKHVVSLSGECSDEIFGGYPWFHRPDMLAADTFPWSMDMSARTDVLRPDLVKRLELEDYVRSRYRESVAETPRLEGESKEEARRREIGWLNLNWFMTNLLDRKDRMSMYSGLEVRVPFCDHHLVEYVWNIPWEMKSRDGVRKQVLRDAAEGLLPEDVRNRPKSPYPKTHNPLFERLAKERLRGILADPNAPIHSLVDREALENGLLRDAGDYGRPWFGQLMAGPQMIAYLIELNIWMERFGLAA